MAPSPLSTRTPASSTAAPLHSLTPQQVQMIEEALLSLGEYGELTLVVEKGRLRFMTVQKSVDIQKWRPGALVELPWK